MAMKRLRNPPEHYFRMAGEIRMIADGMSEGNARNDMLEIANDYERLGSEAMASRPERADPFDQLQTGGPARPKA